MGSGHHVDIFTVYTPLSAKIITNKLTWLSENVESLNLLHLHGNLAEF